MAEFDALTPEKIAVAAGVELPDEESASYESALEARLEGVTRLEMKVDSRRHSVELLGQVLPNVRELRLSDSVLESLRDLGTRLRHLRVLWVSRCGLTSLDGMGALENLEELYAAFNDIEDVSALAGHENLRVLDLEANRIRSAGALSLLGTCGELRELELATNPISTLPLFRRFCASRIPQLETLDGRDFDAEDREPLDAAVLRGVLLAASRLEKEEEEGGDDEGVGGAGSGERGRKGSQLEEEDEGVRLATLLDDDEDERDWHVQEEAELVAETLRAGLQDAEEGVREDAVMERILLSPGDGTRRRVRARPMSASRARSADRALSAASTKKKTMMVAGRMRPETADPSFTGAEVGSVSRRVPDMSGVHVGGDGGDGVRPRTASSLSSASFSSFSVSSAAPSSSAASILSRPSSSASRSRASELTHGVGVVLAGNPANAVRRARAAKQSGGGGASGATHTSILATLDEMTKVDRRDRAANRARRRRIADDAKRRAKRVEEEKKSRKKDDVVVEGEGEKKKVEEEKEEGEGKVDVKVVVDTVGDAKVEEVESVPISTKPPTPTVVVAATSKHTSSSTTPPHSATPIASVSPPSPGQALEMSDDVLMHLLRQKPKSVSQLRTRESYRAFFRGFPRDRMERLLHATAGSEARVRRRIALLEDVLCSDPTHA